MTHTRRIDIVLRILKELVASGADGVAPGAINARLREIGEPMGSWEVRGALTALETSGEIVLDEATATWRLTGRGAQASALRSAG